MALAWELEFAELMALMQSADAPTLAERVAQARPAWMARAACREVDTAVFFPSRGEATDEARAVCTGCPVRRECLAYATVEGVEGVWAGTSKAERRGMRRKAS